MLACGTIASDARARPQRPGFFLLSVAANLATLAVTVHERGLAHEDYAPPELHRNQLTPRTRVPRRRRSRAATAAASAAITTATSATEAPPTDALCLLASVCHSLNETK